MRSILSVVAVLAGVAFVPGQTVKAQVVATASHERGPRFLLARDSEVVPVDVSKTPALARRLNLDLEGATLKTALTEIERQAGLRLAYSDDAVPLEKRVHLRAEAITAAAALTDVLFDAGVDVVFRADGSAALVKRPPPLPTGSIVGRVTNAESGEAIEGVEVSLQGTRWQTLTAADGQYRLADVDTGTYVVTARRIGYTRQGRSVTVVEGQEMTADFALQAAVTKLGEVVVTAQKREERLIDIPISIVAMGADELQRRKVTSLDDLSLAVPGLSIQSSGSYQRRITLRGVSNVFGNSSLIGLYLDEASATSVPSIQLDLPTYDLERVEVLRGPQGTLYGEGSVGGTIRFITKDPLLDRFAMRSDVAALYNTEDGTPGQRIEGALNVPLIKNELGLRIAGEFDHRGGWLNQPAVNRKDYNDQNLMNVRAKGLWQPAPQFKVNATAVVHRNEAPPSVGEDINGDFTQVFNLTTAPSGQDNYGLYNLTLTYDFPAVRVLSTTSYIEQDKEIRDLGNRFQFTPPGTPRFESLTSRFDDVKIVNEELRLASVGSGPWQWTVGAFYRDAQAEFDAPAAYFGLPGPLPDPFSVQTSSSSQSWAVFGDASYRLTGRLTIGTGLRYFEDDQEFTGLVNGVGNPQAGSFDALNPRVYAQYKLTDQFNTYASAAKGFRSGGFNFSFGQPSYNPETVWTYELGTKMSLLEDRLSADLAFFYSDYSDYQIIGLPRNLDPPVSVTSNAGNATIKGLEWAVTWRPTDPWSLSFNGNYVDSEFDEINATMSSHIVGDPLDIFPKYGYTVSAQRDFKLNGRPSFVRLDYNEHGRMTFRNRSIGPWYFAESDVINMLNFSMSLQANESLSLSLFGQNLLNDRGFTDPFSIEEVAARSPPRTLGVGFGVTF